MASWQAYTTGKLTDLTVAKLFRALIGTLGTEGGSFILGGGVGVPIASPIEDDLGAADLRILSSADLTTAHQKFRIAFRRGEAGPDVNDIETRRPSAVFDTIYVRVKDSGDQPSLAEIQKCLEIIREFTSFASIPDAIPPALTAIGVLEAQFAHLNELLRTLDDQAISRGTALEAEFQNRRLELERQFRDREDQLNERMTSRSASLDEQADDIERRKKDLDDRDHMHARRSLRERMTADISIRLGQSIVPRSAVYLRWIVFVLSLLGAGAAGWLAFESALTYADQFSTVSSNLEKALSTASLNQSPADVLSALQKFTGLEAYLPTYLVLARSIIAAAVGLGFLVYAIAWLRRIYQQDVQMHRDFERYSYDLNRASWAIETIMEASSKEGVALPETWIEGVTRNLFEIGVAGEREATSDALAALLGASAKAEVGPGGAKFELKGRGPQKLAKALEGNG